MVDQEGKLKHSTDQAKSTAAETQQEQPGLRNRAVEAEGAAMGSGYANPFSDETFLESSSRANTPAQPYTQRSRSSSTATLPATPLPPPVPPKEPLDPQPQSQQQPRLLIDTEEASNHPSEQLLDLTPTTSASSAAADLTELSHPSHHSETNYWSVHEWAANHSVPQFYTPPRSEADAGEGNFSREQRHENISEVSSGERISRPGSVSDMDVLSEVGGISTPGSWSEVGSVVSEEY